MAIELEDSICPIKLVTRHYRISLRLHLKYLKICMFRFQLHAMASPLQRLPGRVTFEWPAMARRWLGDGAAMAGTLWSTPEAGRDLNGFVVCVCDAKQSTDSMIWQGYTKTKAVQRQGAQWLQMAKTRQKYIHLVISRFSSKQGSAD